MKILEHLGWEVADDENLSLFKAIGVDYVAINPAPDARDGRDRSDFWRELRARVESHGMELYNVGLNTWTEISLGASDRDEKVDAWCTMLRSMAAAEIPTLGYNFKPVGNFRTSSVPIGRGGARYSTFNYDELMEDPPDHPDKHIKEAQLLENLKYFLERVIPVAEECGIRMALPPDDPPIAEPLGGADRIVSSLDHYERIFDLVPSDSNAMLFCQGCVAEMGEDVPAAIRRIGSRNRMGAALL